MGWYENMNRFVGEQMDKFSVWLDAHPGSACHVFALVFLLLLVGTILNWKWAYEPYSPIGREWYNAVGNRTYRFWRGIFYFAVIVLAEFIYFSSY